MSIIEANVNQSSPTSEKERGVNFATKEELQKEHKETTRLFFIVLAVIITALGIFVNLIISSKFESVNQKIDSNSSELNSKIDSSENKLNTKIESVEKSLNSKIDGRFDTLLAEQKVMKSELLKAIQDKK